MQEELALTDDQIAHIEELLEDEPEREQTASHLADVLDLDLVVRYHQLSLQREGLGGLVNDEVAATLGLSEGGFDREAFMKLREELDTKIDEIFTDDQKSK